MTLDPASDNLEYAGFWRRFWAALLDGTFLSIASWTLVFFWKAGYAFLSNGTVSLALTANTYLILLVGSSVLGWVYFAAMETATPQATPGKMAMGLAVTDVGGKRLSFGRATARHFAKWLSAGLLFMGFVMAGVTSKKQALHDLMTDCLVVRRANANQALFRILGFGTLLTVLCVQLAIEYQNEVARQQQVTREEEARVHEAVEVARHSYVLESYRIADEVLAAWLQQIPDMQRAIGWRATAVGNGVYLVSYAFATSSGERAWFFEVTLTTRSVHKITGDPALEAKYGFASALASTPAHAPRMVTKPLSAQQIANCRKMAEHYRNALRAKNFTLVEQARTTSQGCLPDKYVGPCREVVNRYEQLAYRSLHESTVTDEEIASLKPSEEDCFRGGTSLPK